MFLIFRLCFNNENCKLMATGLFEGGCLFPFGIKIITCRHSYEDCSCKKDANVISMKTQIEIILWF